MKGHPAMSKRDFDCSSSYSSPVHPTQKDLKLLKILKMMATIQTQSNQIQKRMSLPSLLPRRRSQKIASTVSVFFCICKTFVGVERCGMLAFGLFPIKELALQVRESDSRILICLYLYTTEFVYGLEPSSFLPILRCFHISRQYEVQVYAFTLAFFFF